MKKIMLLLFACFYACPVWAASPPSVVPAGYPPALESGSPVVSEVDYISPSTVPLTDKEKHALHLSADWSRRNVAPVLGSGGKVVFVHGASLPTILAVPMQVCDVELESGETVNEIVVGDSARWMVDSGTAGSGPAATVHLFIKPVDAGLESSAVVTTDRRVYHLRLVSQRSGHTPYVGFVYSDDLRRTAAARKAAETRRATWESTTVDGERRDLSDLNFGGRYPISRPVIVEGAVRNRAEVLYLELAAHTTLDAVCDRCGKSFLQEKTVPYMCILAEELQNEENDEIVLVENGQVDAGELAREAFILGMDTKTLCSEDCKGLCPRCGADLNVGPCSCKKEVDPRLAVLAKLLENK